MEIYIQQGSLNLRLPVLPPEIEVVSEQGNEKININSLGEVGMIGRLNLKTISLSSFFPAEDYSFCQYSGFPTPESAISLLQQMRESGEPVRLIITGMVNMLTTIDALSYARQDGTKDIHYTIDFTEYKMVASAVIAQSYVASATLQKPQTKRETRATAKTYTVKKGDCLSTIAQKMTGSSSNWKALYNANKNIIGDNPNKIYPGQVLTL